MTRERANELKEVFNAFCEGKEIQFRQLGYDWEDVTIETTWNNNYEYRIKPTEEYRPYESADEMIEDYNERFRADSYVIRGGDLPLIWVKYKRNGLRQLIIGFSKDEVELSDCWVDMQDLFDDYKYLDGSKIGVKIN